MSASNDKARNAPTHAHVCTSTRCMQDQSSSKVSSVSFGVEGYFSPVPSSCTALQGRQAAVVSSSDLQQLKLLAFAPYRIAYASDASPARCP